MKKIHVVIAGVSPLLMHSDKSLDPLEPMVVEINKIHRKGAKKRTDSDEARALELKFHLAIYSNGTGPYVPERCVLGTLRDGARRQRQGKEILAGVNISPDEIPLLYKGPKDPDGLFASKAHRDVRSVVIGKARVVQCRPRFNDWSVAFDLVYDESVVNERDLRQAMNAAGTYVGLCDFRPRFGRFEVTTWEA